MTEPSPSNARQVAPTTPEVIQGSPKGCPNPVSSMLGETPEKVIKTAPAKRLSGGAPGLATPPGVTEDRKKLDDDDEDSKVDAKKAGTEKPEDHGDTELDAKKASGEDVEEAGAKLGSDAEDQSDEDAEQEDGTKEDDDAVDADAVKESDGGDDTEYKADGSLKKAYGLHAKANPYEKGKAPSGPKKPAKDQNAYYKKDYSNKAQMLTQWKWNTFNKRYEKVPQNSRGYGKYNWGSHEWHADQPDSSIHVWIEIPWWARGLLIGKNGKELKKIREESRIQRGYLPPERYAIYLKGTKRDVNSAEKAVYNILKNVKSKIDSKQKRNNMAFDAYVCPPYWRVRDHIDLSTSLQASVFTIQRWQATKVGEDDEPEWEEAPHETESLIMVRCDRNEMSKIYSALTPGVDLVMKVPSILATNILTTWDKMFENILHMVGIVDFQCPPGTDACPHKMFKWKGTYAAIHRVAELFHQLIKDTQVTAEKTGAGTTYRVMELNPTLHSALSQPGNSVISEIERRFDAKLSFVEKHFCYGQGWATENTRTSLLIIIGGHGPVMFAEEQIKELIIQSEKCGSVVPTVPDVGMWDQWNGQQAAKQQAEMEHLIATMGANYINPQNLSHLAPAFDLAAAAASYGALPSYLPGLPPALNQYPPQLGNVTAEDIQRVTDALAATEANTYNQLFARQLNYARPAGSSTSPTPPPNGWQQSPWGL